jgi:YVTN family beta-propeller protein
MTPTTRTSKPLRRRVLSIPASFLVLAVVGCPAPDGQPADPDVTPDRDPATLAGFVFTADEDGNSATRLDLATGETRRVALDISPHNIQASADGSLILIVGPTVGPAHDDGHVHGDAGQLVVLDPGSLEAVRPAIPVGEHPAHVVVDGANRFAYITDSGPDVVLVVDLREGRVVQQVPTCGYPHGLRISPDGREFYVACVESDEVAVIDIESAAEVARIEVGRAPVQVGFTPDGRHVFVSLRDEDAVAVIDARARQVLRSIPVGRGPIQVFATPDGRFMYAANEGTVEQPDSTVSVIDVERGEVVETVTTGAGAHGVVIAPDGSLALISNLFDNTVSVIDVATRSVVATHAVGEGPAGITYVNQRDP